MSGPGPDIQARIAQAKAAGYSDDEIKAALDQGPSFADYVNSATAGASPEPPPPSPKEPNYGFTDAVAHGLIPGGGNEKILAALEAAGRFIPDLVDKLRIPTAGQYQGPTDQPGTFQQEYEKALAARLAARQAYASQHPVLNTVGEMEGTSIPFAAGPLAELAGKAGALKTGGRFLAGAGTGVAVGAVANAAAAKPGDELKAALDPWSAGANALLGGTVAAVAPPTIDWLHRNVSPDYAAKVAFSKLPQIAGREETLAQMAQGEAAKGEAATPLTLTATNHPAETSEALHTVMGNPEAFRQAREFAGNQAQLAAPHYAAAESAMVPMSPEVEAALQDPTLAKYLAKRGFKLPGAPSDVPPELQPLVEKMGELTQQLRKTPTLAEVINGLPTEQRSATIKLLQNQPGIAKQAQAILGQSAMPEGIPISAIQQLSQDVAPFTFGKNVNVTEDVAATRKALAALKNTADAASADYGKARALAQPYKQLGFRMAQEGPVPTPRSPAEAGAVQRVAEATGKTPHSAAPTPFEIASAAEGSPYGPGHYTIRQAIGSRAGREAVPLLRMLLTGSQGTLGSKPLGDAQAAADLLREMAAFSAARNRSTLGPLLAAQVTR